MPSLAPATLCGVDNVDVEEPLQQVLTRRRGLQGLGKSCARAFNSKQRGHGDPTPPKIFPFRSQVSLISMECAARTPNPHEGTCEFHKLHERIRGRTGTPRSGRTGVFTTQRGYAREPGPNLGPGGPPFQSLIWLRVGFRVVTRTVRKLQGTNFTRASSWS